MFSQPPITLITTMTIVVHIVTANSDTHAMRRLRRYLRMWKVLYIVFLSHGLPAYVWSRSTAWAGSPCDESLLRPRQHVGSALADQSHCGPPRRTLHQSCGRISGNRITSRMLSAPVSIITS